MKKINLFFISLLAGIQAFGQPTLNTNNLVPVGSQTVGFHIGDKLDPGSSGANVVWDFSNLTNVFDGDVQILLPSQTPFAAKYSSANYAFQANIGIDTIFQYYDYDATRISRLGDGESITAPGAEVDFLSNSKLWAASPMHYGDVVTDYWKGANPWGVNSGAETIKYDAYGTLITPYDTFTNVIRVMEIRWDTTAGYVPFHDTAYTWFNVNPLYQVAEAGRYNTYITEAFPAPPILTGLNAITKTQRSVSISPNPCTNYLSLQSKDLPGEIQIINSIGQVIRREEFIKGKNEYDISTLAPGLYTCRILSSDGKYRDVQKILVQK